MTFSMSIDLLLLACQRNMAQNILTIFEKLPDIAGNLPFAKNFRHFGKLLSKPSYKILFQFLFREKTEEHLNFFLEMTDIMVRTSKEGDLVKIMRRIHPYVFTLLNQMISLLRRMVKSSLERSNQWFGNLKIMLETRELKEIDTRTLENCCGLSGFEKTESVHFMMKSHFIMAVAGHLLAAVGILQSGPLCVAKGK